MLGDLHPELLAGLGTSWLVSIVTGHVGIVDFKCLLDRFRIQVEDAVQDDLSLLNHVNSLVLLELVVLVAGLILLSCQEFDLSLANIDCVINFEEIRETLLLVGLLFLEMFDKILEIVTLDEHVECHVMNGLGCRTLELDTVLSEIVSCFFVSPCWNLMHGWNERLKGNITEAVRPQSL